MIDLTAESYKKTVERPGVARALVAFFVSELGDGFTTVALPLFVLFTTESFVAVGLTFALQSALPTLVGLFGGVLADALDRKRLVIATFIFRAVLLVLAAAVPNTGAVVALIVVAKAIGAVDNPAMEAAIPHLSGQSFQQAVALRNIGYSAAYAIGPALGGLAVALLGARVAFLVDATTFLVSATLIWRIREFEDPTRSRSDGLSRGLKGVIDDMLVGFSTFRTSLSLGRYLTYEFLSLIAVSVILAAASIYVLKELSAGEVAYGVALGAYGIGSAVGLAFFGRFDFGGKRYQVLLITAFLYGLVNWLGLAIPSVVALASAWVIWGILFGPEQIVGDLVLVENTPEERLGRVYSTFGVSLSLSSVIGYGISGPLVEMYSARSVMLIAGFCFPVLGLLFFWRLAMHERFGDG